MPQLHKIFRKTNSVSGSNLHLAMQEANAISPLQRFVRAKKLINQTFYELTRYLTDVNEFLIDCEISDDLDGDTTKDLNQVWRKAWRGFVVAFQANHAQMWQLYKQTVPKIMCKEIFCMVALLVENQSAYLFHFVIQGGHLPLKALPHVHPHSAHILP